MKYCPKCGEKYDNTIRFCLADGEPLPKSDPEAQTLRMKPDSSSSVSGSTQRIYERVTLAVGDYFDLKTKYRTIRIELKELIEEADNIYSARIYINNDGGLVFGGPGALEVKTNEFWLQPKIYKEEHNAIYYYYNTELDTSFFRLIIEHINFHKKEVEVNLIFLLHTVPRLDPV